MEKSQTTGKKVGIVGPSWKPNSTLQPLYNTVHYNTVLDITRFEDGSQKCIDYIENKNSAEGVIAPAGAKVTGATIRMWLLNKFISFLAVLSRKIGLKKI